MWHIIEKHHQSPPITSNHPPITMKTINQSPFNHPRCIKNSCLLFPRGAAFLNYFGSAVDFQCQGSNSHDMHSESRQVTSGLYDSRSLLIFKCAVLDRQLHPFTSMPQLSKRSLSFAATFSSSQLILLSVCSASLELRRSGYRSLFKFHLESPIVASNKARRGNNKQEKEIHTSTKLRILLIFDLFYFWFSDFVFLLLFDFWLLMFDSCFFC